VLGLLITSFRVWLQAKTRKLHKSFKASPCLCYTKIKYAVLGLNGNIALSFASCYILPSRLHASYFILRIALVAML